MMEYSITSKERSAMYQLLASFFLQLPTIEKIQLDHEMLLGASEIFEDVNLEDLVLEAEKRLQAVSEDEKNIGRIQQEFHDHLNVPISAYYVPPCESSLEGAKKAERKSKKNKDGWLYNKSSGATRLNVELAYKAVGFDHTGLNVCQELVGTKKTDHLGFELAFMAFLNEGEEDSQGNINWNKLQTRFLNDHLKGFSKKYREISLDKSNRFYQCVAEAVESLINWDLESREIQEVN